MTEQNQPDEARMMKAAEVADWIQVRMNGGPPCFHLEDDGRFCFRAERWAGHGEIHPFISLLAAFAAVREEAHQARRKEICEKFKSRDADGRCQCPYCTGDLEALADMAGNYELDKFDEQRRREQAEAEVALYKKRVADIATEREQLEAALKQAEAERDAAERKRKGTIALLSRLQDRFPLCSDHRDKEVAWRCLRCGLEHAEADNARLREALAELDAAICAVRQAIPIATLSASVPELTRARLDLALVAACKALAGGPR